MSTATKGMDVCLWLTLKLNKAWSSNEVSSLIKESNIQDIVSNFDKLDAPIKMRTLLSFLSMSMEKIESFRESIMELLNTAERDSDEWVRIGAGLVYRSLFISDTVKEDFLQSKIEETVETLIAQVANTSSDVLSTDALISLESPYLCKKLQPPVHVDTNKHFQVIGEDIDDVLTEEKKIKGVQGIGGHRHMITRPMLESKGGGTHTTGITPNTAKPPHHRKSMDSNKRSGVDTNRFKRARNKITVLNLDEVKQIETEKQQKEEERKRRASLLNKEGSMDMSPTSLGIQGNVTFPASAPIPAPPLPPTTHTDMQQFNLSSGRLGQSNYPPRPGFSQPIRQSLQQLPQQFQLTEQQQQQQQTVYQHQFPPGFGAPPSYWS